MSFEQEAMREYARNVGREFPTRAWIATPLDSWEKNPYYNGPPVRHPEEDDYGVTENAADTDSISLILNYFPTQRD